MIRRAILPAACGLLALSGCGDEPVAPPTKGPPGFTVLTPVATDTIEAITRAPLVIELRDSSGYAMPGVRVGLFGRSRVRNGSYERLLSLSTPEWPDPATFTGTLSATTDEKGRISVLLRHGLAAGTAYLMLYTSITAQGYPPGGQFSDSIAIQTTVGAPVASLSLPADTSMYLDRTLPLQGAVVDRGDNPRPEPVTYEAGPALAVSAGGVTSATDYARSFVVVHSAYGVDTSWISVVPHGHLLVQRDAANNEQFHTVDLDGSNYRTVPDAGLPACSYAVWLGDAAHFVCSGYSSAYDGVTGMYVADTAGHWRALFPTTAFHSAAFPRYEPTGDWIYFAGQDEQRVWSLWRVHPDGSGATKLGDNFGGTGVDWRPDPAPGGTRVAFTTLGAPEGWGVRVADLTTGTTSSWIIGGIAARWSPTGDRLAIFPNDGTGIRIVNADGTGARTIADGNGRWSYAEGADWSPDGRWLIVYSNNRLELIDVDRELILPLLWATWTAWPSWKR